ncbi:hypothetical protein ABKV19_011008 [Rosa sericea]
MGCGISRFGRNYVGADDQSPASESKPQPQQGVDSLDGVKEKESSPSPSLSPAPAPAPSPAPGLERPEIERIKVDRPKSKEDADNNDNNKHGHEQRDDSIFNYPRSPSFREYCTDSEIRFGVDSSPDNDGDDIDTRGTSRKISKSAMSSPTPNTRDKLVLQPGSNGELATEAKDESKGRTSTLSTTGLKIRNVLGNKWGRSSGASRTRSYFQVSSWYRPPFFTKSVAKAE